MAKVTSIGVVALLLFSVVFSFNIFIKGEQQFSYLASSLLSGKTYFLEMPGTWADSVEWGGKHYWPLGPFPAFLMMPFVWLFGKLGIFFSQGYLQPFIVVGVFYLVFNISQKFKYSKEDGVYWAYAFVFSSVFLNVAIAPWSWWFSQVITTLLLLLALNEYFGKRRHLVVGVYLSLVALTRLTAFLAVVFFVADILIVEKYKNSRIKNLTLLLFPCLIGLILLLLYNYVRFENFFEQGYSYQLLAHPSLQASRDIGLFSIKHLPANLYYFLLSTPTPLFKDSISKVMIFPYVKSTPWGMSIFITSPYMIYLFFVNNKDKLSLILLIASLIIALPIFLYYGIGFRQFGFRYSLDFFPLLFVLLLKNYKAKYKKVGMGLKVLVLFTSLTNLYFFTTIFD